MKSLSSITPVDFSTSMQSIQTKPFLKWAGGKRKLVQALTEKLGKGKRLVEPFVGSGAVFMGSNFESYLLCDTNQDLISLFTILKKTPDALLRQIELFFDPKFNTEIAFYELRDRFNSAMPDTLEKASLFVYLNRHAFNGLCRYNSKGKFNVPYGRYVNPLPPLKEMWSFSQKSQIAEFKCMDFGAAFKLLHKDDVVYCDPPYVPLSATSNFTAYHGAFGPAEQQRLAEKAEAAHNLGIRVVISNHDTPYTRKIYHDARLTTIDVHRSISSKASTRGKAKELIAVY